MQRACGLRKHVVWIMRVYDADYTGMLYGLLGYDTRKAQAFYVELFQINRGSAATNRITCMSDYKTNELFRPGSVGCMNACVGENGGPYDFFDYAWGFFGAADAAVEAALSHDEPVDVLVYPISFCYRHAVELSLKHLAQELPPLWGEQAAFRVNHKLIDTWTDMSGYLKRSPEFDPSGELIPFVDRLLTDFLEFDSTGQVFRYPKDRLGAPHLQDARIINVLVLRDAMRDAREAFKHWNRIASAMAESGVPIPKP